MHGYGIVYFVENHPYEVSMIGAFIWWCFSNFMSHAAPLPSNVGWWASSIHDFLQFVAANPYKFSFNQAATQNPTQPSSTIVEKTVASSLSITPR